MQSTTSQHVQRASTTSDCETTTSVPFTTVDTSRAPTTLPHIAVLTSAQASSTLTTQAEPHTTGLVCYTITNSLIASSPFPSASGSATVSQSYQ